MEKSLQLSPNSPHAFDTRAHIRQALGDPEGALSDYDSAMRHGGVPITRLYQCGLTRLAFYNGEIDGIWRPELTEALEEMRARQGLATRCRPERSAHSCHNRGRLVR